MLRSFCRTVLHQRSPFTTTTTKSSSLFLARTASSSSPVASSSTPPPPLRVCIVGSGPSGFYTAKYLLNSHDNISVDMIEALPTPFGLIRSGVAPDHQDVKSCQVDFTNVAESPRFSFHGNVTVGSEQDEQADISVAQLRQRYNAVVFCTGATSDRLLNIPGEELEGGSILEDLGT